MEGLMTRVDPATLDKLLLAARSHKMFSSRAVTEAKLRELYELAKYAPTSMNCCPMRIVFVTSQEEKAKVVSAVVPSNAPKTESAPVTAIVAYDLEFHERLSTLAPHVPDPSPFASMPESVRAAHALRNSSLQGAFLMVAARAMGLDCGPMSGFDHERIDELFFAGTAYRSNFLLNLGYGTGEGLHELRPRLDFDDACRIV